MDDQQRLSTEADFNAHDAAIDAPPAIGSDERRMHVRAYNYWVSLLDGHDFPSIEDLDPGCLNDFGPHSVLLDFTSGIEKTRIAFLGETLRVECDLETTIHDIAHVPPRSLLSRLTDHYLQIIANRAPIGFEAEFTNHRNQETMYRGILMPFSSDGDTVDFIYGVINWKDSAGSELNNSIANEIDRILAHAPPPIVPQTQIWADGPSHEEDEDEENEAVPRDVSVSHVPDIFQAPLDTIDDLALDQSVEHLEELADWLAAARNAADVARTHEHRGRGALYHAIGLAYDFALLADARPADYAELLDSTGVVVQERAPMTPIVKLVFGVSYDKTRLAEYATALGYAKSQAVPAGAFCTYLEAHDGGIKGILKAARAAKRGADHASAPSVHPSRERARKLNPQVLYTMPGDDEFVILIARRIDADHVGVIGTAAPDERLIDRALKQLVA